MFKSKKMAEFNTIHLRRVNFRISTITLVFLGLPKVFRFPQTHFDKPKTPNPTPSQISGDCSCRLNVVGVGQTNKPTTLNQVDF